MKPFYTKFIISDETLKPNDWAKHYKSFDQAIKCRDQIHADFLINTGFYKFDLCICSHEVNIGDVVIDNVGSKNTFLGINEDGGYILQLEGMLRYKWVTDEKYFYTNLVKVISKVPSDITYITEGMEFDSEEVVNLLNRIKNPLSSESIIESLNEAMIATYKRHMNVAIEKQDYERAAVYRDRLKAFITNPFKCKVTQ